MLLIKAHFCGIELSQSFRVTIKGIKGHYFIRAPEGQLGEVYDLG